MIVFEKDDEPNDHLTLTSRLLTWAMATKTTEKDIL